MSTQPKTGPLTQAELQGIWESAVDPSFWRPLEQAGSGNGFEAYQQAWAQFERVSQAIDATTQSMFIQGWSGQSGAPASGPANATVTIQLTRTKLLNQPLILSKGTLVEEQITDWGTPEGVVVLTGRRYALNNDVVFEPGQRGPLTVQATAERPGWGYNNPRIGTLTSVKQVGTKFSNIDGTVRIVGPTSASSPTPIPTATVEIVYVDAIDQPDAFLPDHVGQYISFTAGANAGSIARIVGWQPPDLTVTPPTGGTIHIERTESTVSFGGSFNAPFWASPPAPGTLLQFKESLAGPYVGTGILQDSQVVAGKLYLTFAKRVGTLTFGAPGTIFVFDGLAWVAEAFADQIAVSYEFTPETFAASWQILDWVDDWGLTATNTTRPSGGRAAMLDALGRERNIFRSTNEGDEAFRDRVANLADVVTPNAIKRLLNKILGALPWCFREAGQIGYPGFFLDHDALDYDRIIPTFDLGDPPYFPDERVTQLDPTTGKVARGRILIQVLIPAGPVPGPSSGNQIKGIADVEGTFVTGTAKIIGESSGASGTVNTIVGGLRDEDRFRVLFDYLRMRAWFYVGVPPLDTGDYGFAYDTGPTGAYDGIGFLDFYDGYAVGAANTYRQVFAAVDKIRAGGTGFDLLLATGPCP